MPRLGLINSLATYRPDDWRKWLEAHLSALLVRLLGMRRAAWLLALRLFPEPWQRPFAPRRGRRRRGPRQRVSRHGAGLARWAIIDRLDSLTSRILMIAAEHDFTPLAEKRALAAQLKADFVVVRGSRHGTPFDSIEATNASLLAPADRSASAAAGALGTRFSHARAGSVARRQHRRRACAGPALSRVPR